MSFDSESILSRQNCGWNSPVDLDATTGNLLLMITSSNLEDLQDAFALIDAEFQRPEPGIMELMLIERDNIKVRMRPEANHSLPHFHLEYKKLYAASYQISPLKQLAGYMPKRYEAKMMDWIIENQNNLLLTWDELKTGKDVRELVIEKEADH